MINPEIAALVGEINFDPKDLYAKYIAERDKRIRPDGNAQYIQTSDEFARYVEDPYIEKPLQRDPVFDEVEVAIIGGGFGALLLGAKLRDEGIADLRLIEAAADVGGTWYWNRYPGAQCDIESYCYLPLLEETNYIPKHRYSYAPEIFEHAKRIASHYRLYENALFQTVVTELEWDEGLRKWRIRTDRGDAFLARFVAMANGPLNKPKLPGIPGISDFQGHTFHTSRWDYDYTGGNADGELTKLRDKRVGIIGTGATAVQVVPHLGRWSKHLYVFQRTPSAVGARNNRETDRDWAASLEPGWQRRRMENFDTLLDGGDQEEDLVHDGWTDIFRSLTYLAVTAASKTLGRKLTGPERGELLTLVDYKKMNEIRARIENIVKNPETAEALKPWYRQFCKRPTFHDDYFPTFNRPNVTLVDTHGKGVNRITATGAIVDGIEYPLDCLVFATGFEVGTPFHRNAGYDIRGRNGFTLSERWADGMRTLHGIAAHGFPNCFFIGRTQTALPLNLPMGLTNQTTQIAYIVRETLRRGFQVIEPTEEGEESYLAELRSVARNNERFYRECTPSYFNNEGQGGGEFYRNGYGGGTVRFFRMLREWRESGKLAGMVMS